MNSNLQRERFCNVLSNVLSDELSRISLFSSSAINHQRIERITQEQTLQNTKKKRGLQSSLFSCPKTHLKYFYYIMNFSKVNVRDLAEANYEDTYLLIITRFPCFTLALYGETFTFCQSKKLLEYEFDSCYILVNYRVKNSLTI